MSDQGGEASPISDGFVQRVLSPALVIVFVAFCLPAVLTGKVLWDTKLLTDLQTDAVLWIIGIFNNWKGLPGELIGLAAQFVPAVIAAICLNKGGATLTWAGRTVFVIILSGLALSVPQLMYLDPENPQQAGALDGGAATIQKFETALLYVANLFLVYLGLLLGFRLSR